MHLISSHLILLVQLLSSCLEDSTIQPSLTWSSEVLQSSKWWMHHGALSKNKSALGNTLRLIP